MHLVDTTPWIGQGDPVGCDIRIEAEYWRNGVGWIDSDLGDLFGGTRCYASYTLLCGYKAMAGITPIAPPRGFPDDTCLEILTEADEPRSPSWVTLAELWAAPWDLLKERCPTLWRVTCLLEEERLCWPRRPSREDVRVVFWFDQ